MLPRRTNNRNSSVRRRDLLDSLGPLSLIIRPYKGCLDNSKICYISEGSEKCIKYLRLGCNCDLIISPAILKRIYNKYIRLYREVRETRVKLTRLKK